MRTGERCRLGDIFWLTRCGQPVPRRAWPAACAVASALEGYSPLLTLAEGLGRADLDETLSEAADAEDAPGQG